MKTGRIAIVRLSSLGDIIHTLPALSRIRAEFPTSSITWFADPRGADLLKNFSGIDEIVPVDLKSGGLLRKIRSLIRVISAHRGKFDLILDFQGLIKSAVFSRLLGKNTGGFGKGNVREAPARFFYRMKPGKYNEKQHVIHKNIHLLQILGIVSEEVVYPVKALEYSEEIKQFVEENRLFPGEYMILNVGGGWDSKVLEVEQDREILSGIRAPLKKVILWGNRREEVKADVLETTTGALKVPFLNFTDLILLISRAAALISADSLPLHLADAVGTVSAGIFGPTSPKRNGSLNRNSISVVQKLDCSFCYKRKCSHNSCLVNLDLSPVTDFINRLPF